MTRCINYLPYMALVSAPPINCLHLPVPHNQPHQPTRCHRRTPTSGLTPAMRCSCTQWPLRRPKGIGVTTAPRRLHILCARRPWRTVKRYQAVPLRPQKLAGTGGIGCVHLSLSSILCAYTYLYLDQKGFRDRQRAQRAFRIQMGWCQEDRHSHRQGVGCLPQGEWLVFPCLLNYMLFSLRVTRTPNHTATRSSSSSMRRWPISSTAPAQLVHMQCHLASPLWTCTHTFLPLPSTRFSWTNLTQVSLTARCVFHSHISYTNIFWNI